MIKNLYIHIFKPTISDETENYIVQNCGNKTGNHGKHYIVDADHGSFSNDGFCRIVVPTSVPGGSYKISVRFYNVIGPVGKDSGYFGLAYNVEDEFNFDLVYLRYV